MTTTTKPSIHSLAKLISDSLERRTRDDGSNFVCFADGFREEHRDIWEKLIDDQPYQTSLDFWYDVLEEVADKLSGYDEDMTEDQAREAIGEIEPDVYTSDLTAWLHSSNYHVEYLGQAVQEWGMSDGFQILQAAQQIAKEEIASGILNTLVELSENKEE